MRCRRSSVTALLAGATSLSCGATPQPSWLSWMPRSGRAPADPLRRAVVSGGRPARTRYVVTERFEHPVELAQLVCTLETGRTHQIRVHLAEIGHPIVGDARYGPGRPDLGLARPYLHAFQLTVQHPATGERLTWTSPLPEDLAAFRATLVPLTR